MATRPPKAPTPEPLMTLTQVAEFASVSTRMVRRLVERDKLRPVYVGRLPRFRPADVRDAFRPE